MDEQSLVDPVEDVLVEIRVLDRLVAHGGPPLGGGCLRDHEVQPNLRSPIRNLLDKRGGL